MNRWRIYISISINIWLEFGAFYTSVDFFLPSPLLPSFCKEHILLWSLLLITWSQIRFPLSLAVILRTLQFPSDAKRHLKISMDFLFSLRAHSLGPLHDDWQDIVSLISVLFCHTHCSLLIPSFLWPIIWLFSPYLVVHFPSCSVLSYTVSKEMLFLWLQASSCLNIHVFFGVCFAVWQTWVQIVQLFICSVTWGTLDNFSRYHCLMCKIDIWLISRYSWWSGALHKRGSLAIISLTSFPFPFLPLPKQ